MKGLFSVDYDRYNDDFIDLLCSQSLMSLDWVHEIYEGADHMDVPIRSLPEGLDFLSTRIVKDL